MPQYLIATYLPDNYTPSAEDEAKYELIYELNREMEAAGVKKFACGLGPAMTLRVQPDGEAVLTDGPYLETKEHVGGLMVLETADQDELMVWLRKGAKAFGKPVEVRPIFFRPAPPKE